MAHIELPIKPGLGSELIESEVEKTKEFHQTLDNLAIVAEDL